MTILLHINQTGTAAPFTTYVSLQTSVFDKIIQITQIILTSTTTSLLQAVTPDPGSITRQITQGQHQQHNIIFTLIG